MYLDSKVTVVKKIEKVSLTAEDWELYCSNEEADGVAEKLNQEFTKLVNLGKDRKSTVRMMHSMMNHYADVGAADTEPYGVLRDLVNYVYGKQK